MSPLNRTCTIYHRRSHRLHLQTVAETEFDPIVDDCSTELPLEDTDHRLEDHLEEDTGPLEEDMVLLEEATLHPLLAAPMVLRPPRPMAQLRPRVAMEPL